MKPEVLRDECSRAPGQELISGAPPEGVDRGTWLTRRAMAVIAGCSPSAPQQAATAVLG